MSANKLRQLRQQAYKKQNRRCFYCDFPIWDKKSESFSLNFGFPTSLLKHLKCTAEHLVARQDSGKDTGDNIVAACLWCNRMRHQGRANKAPDPATYKSHISRLKALGKGHPVAQSQRTKDSTLSQRPQP